MFFSLLFLAFFELRADLAEYCSALGESYCDAEFFCFWDETTCDADENAEVSDTPLTCIGKPGCDMQTHIYNGKTYYVTYSEIKGWLNIDECSLNYAITSDVLNTPVCDNSICGLKNFGLDSSGVNMKACFDFCFAFPDDPSCVACASTSGSVCCAIINTVSCSSYCTTSGTQSYCCGGPAVYDTVNTQACANYAARYPLTMDSDRQRCLADPTNLTACAMCSIYSSCCSLYKNETVSALICDNFCALKPSDKDCLKRKECIDSLGHEPTDAEWTACGTSVVRLSSFCFIFLLGLVGFFVFGL